MAHSPVGTVEPECSWAIRSKVPSAGVAHRAEVCRTGVSDHRPAHRGGGHRLGRDLGRSVAEEAGGQSAGRAIAESGIAERDVPACESCHGSSGRADYPELRGQEADYLFKQLMLFQELRNARGGRYASIMAEVVAWLTAEEMRLVADWYGR